MPQIFWKLIGEFLNSARENDVTELYLLLDAHPILINALDAKGRNALSVAGGREATEFLVEPLYTGSNPAFEGHFLARRLAP